MVKRTGPTNPHLITLIAELKKKAIEESVPLWKRLAFELERPTRQRRIVNLSKINRFTKDNETVVVPGKVLASGLVDHKLTVAALVFSGSAAEKLQKKGCTTMSISELIKKNIKAKDMRIIG